MDALLRWEYLPQVLLGSGIVVWAWLLWKGGKAARSWLRDAQATLTRLAQDKARWEADGGRVYQRDRDGGGKAA